MDVVTTFVLDMVTQIGYPGVLFAMFLVFSFFPLPSQLVLIPGGYLAFQGEMNLFLLILSGSIGGMLGAHFNYWLANKVGRKFIIKYGKYVLISEDSLNKIDHFFVRYGKFSISVGLITPGIGQLISLPAGLAKMDKRNFFFSALFGAVTWNSMMVLLGYFFGEYQSTIMSQFHWILIGLFLVIALFTTIYFYIQKRKDYKNIPHDPEDAGEDRGWM
jgi:membrane protein DedA with SNARE-associated domain